MPTKSLPQGRWGTREIPFGRVQGLIEDTDDGRSIPPEQLPPGFAAQALNVDFDGGQVWKRLGRQAYNASSVAGGATGIHAYYPQDDSALIPILAANGKVYADQARTGTFDNTSLIRSGQSTTRPMSFAQYKGTVYACDGANDPWRWRGPGSASEVAANPVAPTGLTATRAFRIVENVASFAAWSGSGTHLGFNDYVPAGGGTVFWLEATAGGAVGEYASKVWSSGATIDLSKVGSLSFDAFAQYAGIMLRYGIRKNDASIFWLGYVTFDQAQVWEVVTFDLSAIDPADRTASTGQVIGWAQSAPGLGYPQDVYIGPTYAADPLIADTYHYYVTAVNPTNGLESAPGGPVELVLPVGHQSSAVDIAFNASGEAGVTQFYLWRHHNDAGFSKPIRVATLTNVAPVAITGATNATPIVITAANHGLVTGDKATIAGVVGNTAANGVWTVTRLSASTFSLQTSIGSGAYTSGGTVTKLIQVSDTYLDAQALIDSQPFLQTLYQIDPPKARAYAVVNRRLLAGAVTIGGTYYPSRLYLSRDGIPEGMTSSQNPDDPTGGGFWDLAEKDGIVRIVEVGGAAVIFCERSVWVLEGDGWDNYVLRQRAFVGLDAYWSVAVWGHLVFFLAEDGLRVLEFVPRAGLLDSQFNTWVVSEPIANRLRGIPAAARGNAACGIDERQRLHLSYAPRGGTVNSEAVILDLRAEGALTRGPSPLRPGWTAYDGWGYTCFASLKRGGGDYGQLLAGDPALIKAWLLQVDRSNVDLETDAGAAIAWRFRGSALDHGRNQPANLLYLAADCDPAPGQSLVMGTVVDFGDVRASAVALGSAASGIIQVLQRVAPVQWRYLQAELSGSHSVRMRVRSAAAGVYL